MFKFWNNIFRSPYVRQTGHMDVYPRSTDYLAGTLPYEVILPKGDWTKYVPFAEKQYLKARFDTKSCTTFTVINEIETQIKKITGKEYNFSDRFIAILSGTTRQGNNYLKVIDTIREIGLIPETVLPFGGNSFEEYHDKSVITNKMLEEAKKFLEEWEIGYEWVFYTLDKNLSEDEEATINYHLKHAPLAIAVPVPSYHALMLASKDYFFDTYEPFIYKKNKPLNYGLKIVVRKKKSEIPFGILKRGASGELVKDLQREIKKHLPEITIDGSFGPITERAVKFIQAAAGLRIDGIYGSMTKNALEKALWLPVTNFTPEVDKIVGLNPILLSMNQRARNELGSWIIVNSGKRTKAENERVGGEENSSHLDGLGEDLVVKDIYTQDRLARIFAGMGVVRIGKYPRHLHVDISLKRPQVSWVGKYNY